MITSTNQLHRYFAAQYTNVHTHKGHKLITEHLITATNNWTKSEVLSVISSSLLI